MFKSEGKCVFCQKMYSKRGLGRHLATHLEQAAADTERRGTALHLKVDAGEMFLHLLVNGTTRLSEIDGFLRGIWMECCGHMSSFEIKGNRSGGGGGFMDGDEDFGLKKSSRAAEVFTRGTTVQYDYDFGSTTRVELSLVNAYPFAPEESLRLLTRNEPLPIRCHLCKKQPAVTICSVHMWDGACMFCEKCADKHAKKCEDFADYAAMDVVNSPRMGICAYEGGTIDRERDGVFSGTLSGEG